MDLPLNGTASAMAGFISELDDQILMDGHVTRNSLLELIKNRYKELESTIIDSGGLASVLSMHGFTLSGDQVTKTRRDGAGSDALPLSGVLESSLCFCKLLRRNFNQDDVACLLNPRWNRAILNEIDDVKQRWFKHERLPTYLFETYSETPERAEYANMPLILRAYRRVYDDTMSNHRHLNPSALFIVMQVDRVLRNYFAHMEGDKCDGTVDLPPLELSRDVDQKILEQMKQFTFACQNAYQGVCFRAPGQCKFAHSPMQLRPKPKFIPCTDFVEKGVCPYNEKCWYGHFSQLVGWKNE